MHSLVESIKKISLDVTETSKMANIFYGTVIEILPLKINIEQKITLESPQLVLTRNVTEYTLEMTVDHSTEPHNHLHSHLCADNSCNILPETYEHYHDYAGRKKFIVHNALLVGEKVLLIRQQGGQKFIVLDRI